MPVSVYLKLFGATDASHREGATLTPWQLQLLDLAEANPSMPIKELPNNLRPCFWGKFEQRNLMANLLTVLR